MNTNVDYRNNYRANRNAYVVTSCSIGKGHDNETHIEKVFGNEESAKAWIDNQVLEWLKNQSTFDPDKAFSGDVKYGKDGDEFYVIIDFKIKDDKVSYTAYDYSIYDYE